MLMRTAANTDHDATAMQDMVGSARRMRCDRIRCLRRRFGVTRNICGAEHDFDVATWRPRGHGHASSPLTRFLDDHGGW